MDAKCFCLLTLLLSVSDATRANKTLHSYETCEEATNQKGNLSILLVSGAYIGHHFPMIALGEELASRGHKVAILGPTIEGSNVLSTLPGKVGVEFISAGFLPKQVLERSRFMGKDMSYARFLYRVFGDDERQKWDMWLVMLRKGIDRQDPRQWDYVVVDNVATVIMYYIIKQWKTNRVMVNVSPLFAPLASSPPWPSPVILSGLRENMSFQDRSLNTIYCMMQMAAQMVIKRFLEPEDALKIGEDYFSNVGVTHPVLLNTVLGFEYPRPLLPLMHYTGPLFMRGYTPLDPQLQGWLEDKREKSVVYISMGSMAELTSEQGRSILEGIMASHYNYSVIWSLRESNKNAIEEVKIDPKRTFIASWVSQFTMLQHKAVAMAILHCGIGGVQEALYNKVPVICVPYGYDQFDTAARLEDWGLGVRISSTNLNAKEVSDAVERVGSGEFDNKVKKMSIILRASGGTKEAADLVELYAEVGHDHGVPAIMKHQWNWIEYYNKDMYWFILVAMGVLVWVLLKRLGVFSIYARLETKVLRYS